jgi:polysaccharide export outer membrane protein
MTLLAALARAGSTTPTAGREVTIVRPKRNVKPGEDPSEILRVNLAELQAGNMSLNIALQDGDTINIPKAQSVFVAGQVKSPGAYAVDPGATVLQVLSLAGGLTDRGSDNRIRIQRTVNGKKVEVSVKLTDVVNPGDTIIVRERFF